MDDITTSKIDPSPKKAYFRCVGNDFNSKSDGFLTEEIGLSGLCPISLSGLSMKISELVLR